MTRVSGDGDTAEGDVEPGSDRMPVLLVRGDREYLVEPGDEMGTDLGVLEVPEDVQPGDTLETHLGDEFQVRRLRGPDLFHHFERTGAPMVPRDIGLVIGETGIAGGDRVLDAGTGTGVLAAMMGRAGADVVTYERDADFADVARENMALGGVSDAVDVRTGDVTEQLEDLEPSSFDVMTLDTGDAATMVEHAPELLVDGGFVAVYSPFIESTSEVVETAHEVGLSDVTTRETIQREMQFDDRGTRPSTAPVGHTGYLTIARNE
ncbi:methyltransferase domain-containing protein [Natrinema hispanicum]|uniref:tRNA (Adenine57-N1/adenine58-N1)-methyltransferase n=1 Tax=Natrinema hispanicum TaxID=392421 RepID=A0A1I0FMY1_9EURY|nr:methyltransferase domain-containing protein [Natrinema hispanicum]SDC76501.1 tRNA (adenine57-N1/adenine58-N1)-methyltransferase [Natrinema hispanicum]SET59680.1 tRNA (adenine57-N1/adenine58-N1)-methyltransferase [Natrinema hispanicum]